MRDRAEMVAEGKRLANECERWINLCDNLDQKNEALLARVETLDAALLEQGKTSCSLFDDLKKIQATHFDAMSKLEKLETENVALRAKLLEEPDLRAAHAAVDRNGGQKERADRLEAENARLREALEKLVELFELDEETCTPNTDSWLAMTVAREALEAKP